MQICMHFRMLYSRRLFFISIPFTPAHHRNIHFCRSSPGSACPSRCLYALLGGLSPIQPAFPAAQKYAFLSYGTLPDPNRAPHRGFPFPCLRTLRLCQTNDMIQHMGSLAQLRRCSPSMAEVAGSTSRIRANAGDTTGPHIKHEIGKSLAQEARHEVNKRNGNNASNENHTRGPPRPLIRRARSHL